MYLILDTNIILLDAQNLLTLGADGSTIILPETVLDEIDSKKSGTSEIAYQARQFGRMLTRATSLDSTSASITRLSLEGIEVQIWSSTYPDYDDEPKIKNDRKILFIAQLFKDEDHLFITNDVMCRIRATSLGLNASDFRVVELNELSFSKDFHIDTGTRLHNVPILEVDPDYKPHNYNYRFIDPSTGQVRLGYISNSIIQVIGKETELELRRQDINPINSGQLFFSKALQDPLNDIVIAEAKAGTGKTAVAISNGIRLVRQGHYQSITYIRASVDDVDKVEQIGFLSGNDEKLAVYLHPLEDTLDFISRNRRKGSKVKGEELERLIEADIIDLKQKCNIQAMIGLGMRGRTFNNTYAIIDEAQGMSKASLQKVLTRFGKNCKIVIIGSNNQIDNPYLTKYTNGLSVLLDACTQSHDSIRLHAVNLEKVVRSSIAEFAEHLFTERS